MKRRFRVKVHPAGITIFAAAFLFMDSHRVLAAFTALVLHEGAHLAAMLLCGMKKCTVELTPFGGVIDASDFDVCSPWKKVISSGAGVTASAALTCACVHMFPRTLFAEAFFEANASLALINALPLWPLDGARVAAAFAAFAGLESVAKRWLSHMTMLAGMLFILLGIYGVWNGIVNPTLLAAGPYLWYTARAEFVSGKVRRVEGIDRKLQKDTLVPAALFVGNAESISAHFTELIGRTGDDRCQVVLAVDPESGHIQKWWTEKEILNSLLDDTRN